MERKARSFCMGVVLALSSIAASAQRTPYQATPHATQPTTPASAASAPVQEIYVDHLCRLLPDPASVRPGKKPHLRRDPAICHLEAMNNSVHREERVVGNELERANVAVREQQYVLQDIYPEPVAFMVVQPVGPGWTIDSDPAPVKAVGDRAIFRAMAQPGEIVSLHVGIRRTEPLKSVSLRPLIPASPPPTGPPPVGTNGEPAGGFPAPPNVSSAAPGTPGPQ